MANNILDIPETPEEWKAKAQEALGDPLSAIIQDAFRQQQEQTVSSPEFKQSRNDFMERLQNGTAQNIVAPSSLQVQHGNSTYGEMSADDVVRPVDKADEKMEAQLRASSKVYGPNEVGLIRTNDPAVIAQAKATADRMGIDVMIGTKDGFILHGNSPAMQATIGKFAGAMENGNTLPVGENTNMGALANGVVGEYRTESWMEMAHESGIVEKPGVSYTVRGAVEVSESANIARAMQKSGVHNPAVVAVGKDGTGYIMLDTHNPVAQDMVGKHTPVGQADGLAQFKFDSRQDMAAFLTEMSDMQHEMDTREADAIGLDENDGLDEVGDIE